MAKTRKIIIIGAIGAIVAAALAVGVNFALSPRPAFANAMFGPQFGGFGPWHAGQGPMMWQAWHGGSGFMMAGNQSRANWTGSVSVQSLKSGIIDTVKSKVKIDIVDAASIAEKSIGNGSKIGAITLAPVNGYVVYQAYGIDSSNQVHKLIIDVGNGTVLDNTRIDIPNGFGPWSNSGFGGGMQK